MCECVCVRVYRGYLIKVIKLMYCAKLIGRNAAAGECVLNKLLVISWMVCERVSVMFVHDRF